MFGRDGEDQFVIIAIIGISDSHDLLYPRVIFIRNIRIYMVYLPWYGQNNGKHPIVLSLEKKIGNFNGVIGIDTISGMRKLALKYKALFHYLFNNSKFFGVM